MHDLQVQQSAQLFEAQREVTVWPKVQEPQTKPPLCDAAKAFLRLASTGTALRSAERRAGKVTAPSPARSTHSITFSKPAHNFESEEEWKALRVERKRPAEQKGGAAARLEPEAGAQAEAEAKPEAEAEAEAEAEDEANTEAGPETEPEAEPEETESRGAEAEARAEAGAEARAEKAVSEVREEGTTGPWPLSFTPCWV